MSPRKTTTIQKALMKEYNYTVFFEPLEEGGYNVVVPALPEICTFGETLAEAREMAQDAIRCHLEGLLELGQEIPADAAIDRQPLKELIPVTLAA